MSTCWQILEISPTSDPEIVKRAWRSLVRKYHPDTVSDPQLKEQYTARCAELNAAYAEATKLAEIRARIESSLRSIRSMPRERLNRSNITPYAVMANWGVSLLFLLFIILFFTFPRVLAFLVISGFFVFGLATVVCFDLLLYRILLRPMLARFSLSESGSKNPGIVASVLLFTTNVVVLRIFDVGQSLPIFYAAVMLLLPAWLLGRLLRRSPQHKVAAS